MIGCRQKPAGILVVQLSRQGRPWVIRALSAVGIQTVVVSQLCRPSNCEGALVVREILASIRGWSICQFHLDGQGAPEVEPHVEHII